MTSLTPSTLKHSVYILGTDASTTEHMASCLRGTSELIKSNVNLCATTPPVSLLTDASCFSSDRYTSRLGTTTLGRNMLYAPLLDSTQTVMQNISNKIPHGTVCLADQQTAGRGRGANAWYSPPGCLLFTFTFATKDGRNLPFAQYLLSLALVKAVQSMPHCTTLPIKIKWPNDIYAQMMPAEVGEKNNQGSGTHNPSTTTTTTEYASFAQPPQHGQYSKIGGVLCESTYDYESKSFVVIAGIGLNVTNEAPTTCLQSMHSDQQQREQEDNAASSGITREHVLASFFNTFEPMLEQFNINGFDSFYDAYIEEWLHSGQTVMVCDLKDRRKQKEHAQSFGSTNEGGDEEEGEKTEVTIIGVAKSSGLLAVDQNGQQFELLPDGNSFDFLKGLISRKI